MTATQLSGAQMVVPRLSSFYELRSYDTLDSTNEEARRLAEDGAAAGTLVWSVTQNEGRGRRGRAWSSPAGNLYASLILRPDCEPYAAAQLSLVAALAIHQAVANALPTPERAFVKWPNDVLIGGRKVAGILLESRLQTGNKLDWLIIGSGINIVTCPDDLERPATSLHDEGSDADVVKVLEDYSSAFEHFYQLWLAEGFSPIRRAWLDIAHGVGEEIEVRLENETFSGVFDGLNGDGALQLQTSEGLRLVTSGDVFLPSSN